MVTSFVARMYAGVLAAFGVNVTVTPDGIFTDVKLNTPFGGSCKTVFDMGVNAPSAPVLPLTKVPAEAMLANPKSTINNVNAFLIAFLLNSFFIFIRFIGLLSSKLPC
jgi:hypothetical protein